MSYDDFGSRDDMSGECSLCGRRLGMRYGPGARMCWSCENAVDGRDVPAVPASNKPSDEA